MGCVLACGVLFDYLRETQRDFLPQIEFPRYYDTVNYMKIDEWTARNLELRSSTDGSQKYSLLGVIDETRPPMGARLLRRWMNYPLLDIGEIKKRQDAAGELLENLSAREDLMEALRQTGDLERLIHRIETPSARPRDLASLRDSSFYIENSATPCGIFARRLLTSTVWSCNILILLTVIFLPGTTNILLRSDLLLLFQ